MFHEKALLLAPSRRTVVGVLGLVLVVIVLLPLFLVARRVFAEGRAPDAGTLVLMAITATGLAYQA